MKRSIEASEKTNMRSEAVEGDFALIWKKEIMARGIAPEGFWKTIICIIWIVGFFVVVAGLAVLDKIFGKSKKGNKNG